MSEFASVRALQRLLATEKNDPIPYSLVSNNYYLHKYDNACPICSKNKYLTKHHVRPIGQGGRNMAQNYFYVCRDCHDIIDNIRPAKCRMDYACTILKMFKILHNYFPGYYNKSYIYYLLWISYGISSYEIDVYCLIEEIEEYKDNPYYLYVKLLRLNQNLPDKEKIIFSYDFNKNKIKIDKVTFAIQTRYHGLEYQSYHWKQE